MRLKELLFGAAATVAVTVFGVSSVSATLLVEETFSDYATNSNLSGANGGTGWNGGWSVGHPGEGFANQVRSNVFSFSNSSYPGYTTASGGNYFNNFGLGGFNFGERFIDTTSGAFSNDGNKVYGSFLYQGGGTNEFRLRTADGDNFLLPPTTADGTAGLVLYRIELNTGNTDTLTAWYNPTLATFDENITPASLSGTGNYAINKVIWVMNGGNENRIDDIRLGTTLVDVVAIPEPASLALVASAGLLLLRRRSASTAK